MKKNNEIDTTTVGGRIQKLREENNMTQAALAEELHLENKSSISRYESNRSTPTPELFVEMARLFGTTTDYILSGEMPARSSKLMQAEAILQGMKLDKTLDAAITMLMTLKGLPCKYRWRRAVKQFQFAGEILHRTDRERSGLDDGRSICR